MTKQTKVEVVTKIQQARTLFQEVYAADYKLTEGVKSLRQEFLKRAQEEIGMTPSGAATYHQNLSNEAKGEKLYKYSATKKVEAEAKAS